MSKQRLIDECNTISSFIWDWIKKADSIPHGRADERGITSFMMTKMEEVNFLVFYF